MKIAQYVETFSYVGMFNTMNFASYICLYLISPFMQHPVVRLVQDHFKYSHLHDLHDLLDVHDVHDLHAFFSHLHDIKWT